MKGRLFFMLLPLLFIIRSYSNGKNSLILLMNKTTIEYYNDYCYDKTRIKMPEERTVPIRRLFNKLMNLDSIACIANLLILTSPTFILYIKKNLI
jgi:hypothetical protein